jgi:hypothetical protein
MAIKLFHWILWALAVLMIQGCGGSSSSSDKYSISTNQQAITFNHEFLSDTDQSIQLDVSYRGDGLILGFAPQANPAQWLSYRIEEVTDSRAIIHIDLDNLINENNPSQGIPPGNYHTVLRVSTGDLENSNLVHADINIDLYIWALLTSTNQLTYGDTFGSTEIDSQELMIVTSETSPSSWQLSSNVSWISFAQDSGVGNAEVAVSVDPTQLDNWGLHQGEITLTEVQSQATKTINVDLGLDALRLLSSDETLAFSALKNSGVVSQTVTISSNAFSALDWQASSNSSWLNLESDVLNNTLTVSIADNGLDDNQLYQGQIQVAAVNTGEALTETIAVSFYKNLSQGEQKTLTDVMPEDDTLVVDPIRPWLYLASGNRLFIYHLYTGELLSEHPLMLEVTNEQSGETELSEFDYRLENFVVHPDGSSIIITAIETLTDDSDPDNIITSEQSHYISFNTSTFSYLRLSDATIQSAPEFITRFDGLYFVVTAANEFADLALVVQDWQTDNIYFSRSFARAGAADTLFTLDSGATTIRRYTGQANAYISPSVTTELTHEYRSETTTERELPPENEGDEPTTVPASLIFNLAVSDDEQHLYTVSEALDWITFDGENFSDQPLLNSSDTTRHLDVDIAANNNAYFLDFDSSAGFRLAVYNDSQQLTANNLLAVTSANALVSGYDDNRLALANAAENIIELITVAQFTPDVSEVHFNTIDGNASVDSQTLTLSGMGDSWTATSSEPWLTVSPGSGSGDASLTLSVDASLLNGPGLYQGDVIIFDADSGSFQTITVNFAIDQARLFATKATLALVSTADISQLNGQLRVLTNGDTVPEWQASTDASWLSLSQSGDLLTVNAALDSLTDGFHQTQVTLASNSGNIAQGTINIGLYIDSNASQTVIINDISTNTRALARDPLRPYTYIGMGDSIFIYHSYSGSLVNTIASPLTGVDLEYFVLSEDGASLYASAVEVIDAQNQITHHYRLDLATQSLSELDGELIDIQYRPIYSTRIDGIDIIVTQALEYADADLKLLAWDQANAYIATDITRAAATNDLFIYRGDTIAQHQGSYNSFAQDKLSIDWLADHQSSNYSGIKALSLTADAMEIYTAGAASEWSTFNGSSYLDQGLLHDGSFLTTLSVLSVSNDLNYFFRFKTGVGYSLSSYDSNQLLLNEQSLAIGHSNLALFSGDAKRLISHSSALSQLQLLTID